jgi:hypothetical protein
MAEPIWIVIVIVLIFLVIGFIRLYLKNQLLKKTRQHLLNVPAFDKGLIDCYVRVSGSIKSKNTFSSPISKIPCAFYLVKVLALWQTKRKKPAKGMEEQKKVIFQTVSPLTQLEISEGTYYNDIEIIQVDMSEFFEKANCFLMDETTESRNCPDICKKLYNHKYRSYKILETWCSHADKIVVYGKLVKTHESLLKIKPTELAAYPSFICLEPFEEVPFKKLEKKIRNNKIWLIVDLIGIIGCLVYVV